MLHKTVLGAILFSWILLFVMSALPQAVSRAATGNPTGGAIVLINGELIDGTGAAPRKNAVVVIQDGKILFVGKQGETAIPAAATVVDLKGAAILPGFINTHVHYAFDPEKLAAWAAAGVTTVRDLAVLNGRSLAENFAMRREWLKHPEYARLLAAGPGLTAPNGYVTMFVDSPEHGRQIVNQLADDGAATIKVTMEDGYAGTSGLPKLTPAELQSIIQTAHARGLRVSAHITQAQYLEVVVKAGVDEAVHLAYDRIPDALIALMVKEKVSLIPTFSVYRVFGVPLAPPAR